MNLVQRVMLEVASGTAGREGDLSMANPIELREARARVLALTEPSLDHENVPLAAALGRTLAESVSTDTPWPVTDRSAMDGFAFAIGEDGLAAGQSIPVVGESLAGKPFDGVLPDGKAIRIMTGAVVPEGASTVVPVEDTSGYEGELVTVNKDFLKDANIRRCGSELDANVEVLSDGRRVHAAEVGVLAVLGQHRVSVRRQPKVFIVATGDEVVPVEQSPQLHQVRESNSWALAAQVQECGGVATRLGIAPDEKEGLRAVLVEALADADVVLTIGGISKGTHDLVHSTLAELGVVTEFHGIKLKPGKPTYFGRRQNDGRTQYVFGLPGNPASTFTVFDLLVRPMLSRWLGHQVGEWGVRLPLGDTTWKKNWRLQAVPAQLVPDAAGNLVAKLAKPSPSGDPFSLLFGSCYALIPSEAKREDCETIELAGGSRGPQLP